jgi:amino acid transporter
MNEGSPAKTLHQNAIGLAEVLFQSVTAMAPASAVAFSLGAAVPFAGTALPLATLIALAVCMLIALNIAAMAKYLPSAGGYFTYVSRGLGDTAGWLTGWLFSLSYVLVVPLVLLVLGPLADDFAGQHFHLAFGWIGWAVVIGVLPLALTLFGVKLSSDSSVILGAIEIVIFLALSIWLIVTRDHPPIQATFSPKGSLEAGLAGWQGLLHGMIFAFLAFAGFESSAPLAEEAREPRRTVPRAIVLATLSIGLFYCFCSYAAVVGWGANRIASFATDPNPWGTMAKQAWGARSVIIIFAILNSGLGNAVAGINAASRSLFAMSRAGTLPRRLAHVNQRYRTPDIAILATAIIGTLLTVWLGSLYGPSTAFALVGTMVTILILIVYVATCLSVPLFYYREHRSEFRIGRHILLPLVPTVALVFPIWAQFSPAPAPPINLAGPVCGVWVLIGVVIVVILRRRAPQTLAASGQLIMDEPGRIDEMA